MLLDIKKPLPVNAPVPCNGRGQPAAVLIDTGTGKRIPFPFKVDLVKGEAEHYAAAANGHDVAIDAITRKPFRRTYKAVGQLKFVPFENANSLGLGPPKKKESVILPLTKEEKVGGMMQYKKLYFEVGKVVRGDSDKVLDQQWQTYLQQNNFLDDFILPLTRKFKGVHLG